MASAQFWKLSAVDVWTFGQDLTLSEVALYESDIAQAGSVTCPTDPIAGTLSNLSDGSEVTTVTFASADVFSPGFAITWDLGSAKDITRVGIKGSIQGNFPRKFEISYSTDGVVWVTYGKVTQSKWTNSSTFYELDVAHGNPNIASTTVLLNFDARYGVNAVNVGTASLSTTLAGTAKFVSDAGAFGGGALLFNTLAQSSDHNNYLFGSSPGISALSFAGDFTIYCRVYAYAYSWQWGSFLLSTVDGNSNSGSGLNLAYGTPSSANKVYFGCKSMGILSNAAMPLNQWVELMITCSDTTVRMFVNGVLQTETGTLSGATGASQFLMGRSYNSAGSTGICGMVDELVLIDGIALATDTYSPRTTPFAQSLMGPTVGSTDVSPIIVNPVQALSLVGPTVGNVQQSINVRTTNLIADNANGVGTITGTVKEKALPTNLPLSRKVRLMREWDGKRVRETWSDATTGDYTFTGLDVAQVYTAIASDHLRKYRATVADNLAATR